MWQHTVTLIQQRSLNYGVFVMAVFIISIYLSTALAIILSVVLGCLWLITKQYKILPTVFKNTPVATWAVLLFLCFIVGLGYGHVSNDEAFSIIRKYRELLFIPLFSCFFTNERYRFWAWKAFILASVVTLIGSYLMDFGILDMFRYKTYTLKSRITHSIFIAFFMFFCAHKMAVDKQYKAWYLIGLVLGTYNLFFVVDGRTGQLIFLCLAPLFAGQRFGMKGLLVSLVGLIFLVALYVNYSDKSARIHEGVDNTQAYLQHAPVKKPTSMSIRYKFWDNSFKILAAKPWFGYGTGSFSEEYKRVSGAKKEVKNPHNEFLLFAVQFGLLGAFTYCGFLVSQYWGSRKLAGQEKWLAQGLLLTLIITSLFNSPFLDHTEGHWFALMIALCFTSNSSTGESVSVATT